ncbi:MAG: efflux RND transporter periplasmic adaptor subunit [Opitutaceae bacterium]|nr:efflux RND transporter periplasmic adaptor subunit [Opitutaceae bacterium]
MKPRFLSLVAAGAAIVFLTGCGSGNGASAHADAASHGAEPPPAVVFKAGRGLQLSPTAAAHIGLSTTEVATRDLPGAIGVPAIPASALLRTVRGDFVFVANGGWLLRTPVVVGAVDSGWVEVKDGLYEGDTVVALGTRALWLAEIQAVNGGVSCTHGH